MCAKISFSRNNLNFLIKSKFYEVFANLFTARPVRTLRTYNYQLTVLRVSSIQEKRNFEKQIFIKTHLSLSEVEPWGQVQPLRAHHVLLPKEHTGAVHRYSHWGPTMYCCLYVVHTRTTCIGKDKQDSVGHSVAEPPCFGYSSVSVGTCAPTNVVTTNVETTNVRKTNIRKV